MERFEFQQQKDQPCFSLPLLVLRWENSLERDTEIQHQIRLHICMRLAATNVGDCAWMHHCICRRGLRSVNSLTIVGPVGTCRVPKGCINGLSTNAQIASECMRVRRQLLNVY